MPQGLGGGFPKCEGGVIEEGREKKNLEEEAIKKFRVGGKGINMNLLFKHRAINVSHRALNIVMNLRNMLETRPSFCGLNKASNSTNECILVWRQKTRNATKAKADWNLRHVKDVFGGILQEYTLSHTHYINQLFLKSGFYKNRKLHITRITGESNYNSFKPPPSIHHIKDSTF